MKPTSIIRLFNMDTTTWECGSYKFTMVACPIKLWKKFYWGAWGKGKYFEPTIGQRIWAIQSPWLSFIFSKQ